MSQEFGIATLETHGGGGNNNVPKADEGKRENIDKSPLLVYRQRIRQKICGIMRPIGLFRLSR